MDLFFNKSLAESYKSGTQKIRVLSEDWVDRNLYCPICGCKSILRYSANRPVADFYCDKCNSDFELKSKESKSGKLGLKIADGAYDTMIERITSLRNPNFFFLTYNENQINNVILIPKHFFTPQIIEKRKPLAPSARRAGWVGCNINITGIPSYGKIYIIKDGKELPHTDILSGYKQSEKLISNNLSKRGWIMDTLNCIDKINSETFSLAEMYNFAEELKNKHPDNNFIKDKIRQQLQLLRDKEFIEFISPGKYRKKI